MSARKVATDFTFDGQRIPKGTVVLYSPYVTHRLSAGCGPNRSGSGRNAGTRPTRTTGPPPPPPFLPFGGGPHRCIGAGFATTGIKVVLTQLLRRVEARTVGGPVRPTSITAMRHAGVFRWRSPKYGRPFRHERAELTLPGRRRPGTTNCGTPLAPISGASNAICNCE